QTVWDILQSCIVTIFACTWISVHPNVPGPKLRAQGWFFLSLRRVKLMIFAILCPEGVIMWAFWQRLAACSATRYHPLDNLSMTHGFFIAMGGFIDAEGTTIELERISMFHKLELPQGLYDAICKFTREELLDRSKGDILSKLLSLLQTT
ncbi:hypothetical protein ARMGADRAFT_1134738, partial [Armillaria gallica]